LKRRIIFLWAGLVCLAIAGLLLIEYETRQQGEETKSILESLANKTGQFTMSYSPYH
jgi:hypothetical protein